MPLNLILDYPQLCRVRAARARGAEANPLPRHPEISITRPAPKAPGAADRKPLHWVGSSMDALRDMPEEVRRDFGRRLNLAQRGRLPPGTKSWQGLGARVFEMLREYDTDAYRAVYAARFGDAIYVLHAFQKKSPKGKRTDTRDIKAIEEALRGAEAHYRATYRREGEH